jgi:hypothetical protein
VHEQGIIVNNPGFRSLGTSLCSVDSLLNEIAINMTFQDFIGFNLHCSQLFRQSSHFIASGIKQLFLRMSKKSSLSVFTRRCNLVNHKTRICLSSASNMSLVFSPLALSTSPYISNHLVIFLSKSSERSKSRCMVCASIVTTAAGARTGLARAPAPPLLSCQEQRPKDA